jgi:[ribosomal protein S5]-alanine N-acetyltransferase
MSPGRATARPPDFPGTELLRTRRLRLRGLRYADAFELQALGRDPRATSALLDGPVGNLAEACALVETANRVYRDRPGLGVWRADDAEGFIGFFSLMAELEPGEVEIGTRLLPRAWGRNYALEGGVALCDHAFGTLQLPALHGLCDPRNRSVPPLLARLGFARDGQVEQRGRPALRFVLHRGDWRGIRRRVCTGSAAGPPPGA